MGSFLSHLECTTETSKYYYYYYYYYHFTAIIQDTCISQHR